MARIFAYFLLLILISGTTQAAEPEMLKERMNAWEKQMIAFQSALYRHEFKKMADAMHAIENSGALPPRVSGALKSSLEEQDYKDYMKLDKFIRGSATVVAEQAEEGNVQKLLMHQGRLLMTCIQCHDMFMMKAASAMQGAAAQ